MLLFLFCISDLFSLFCFHFRFVFARVSFLGNVLPYRDLCSFFWLRVSVQGCGFPFWLVYFCFLFCIFFFICCFCSGEKLLLHRGFGKFGKSLYTYGFHFFKFVSEWTDLQMQVVEGGRVGPFI